MYYANIKLVKFKLLNIEIQLKTLKISNDTALIQ